MNRFFDQIQLLDKLLSSEPSVAKFSDQVVPLLAQPQALRYFYTNIDCPDWLPVLRDYGVFASIPEPREVEGSEEEVYPVWYPVYPLQKLATAAPKLVMEIVLELPPTENQTVHLALMNTAEAALIEAPELVCQWLVSEAKWIEHSTRLDALVVDAAASLIRALSPTLCKSAFDLTNSIFALSATDDPVSIRYSKRLKMSEWQFGEVATQLRRPLTQCSAKAFIDLILGILASLAGSGGAHELDQRLLIWRPAVEDSGQNSPNSLLSTLVEVIRDSSLQTIEAGDTSIAGFMRESPFATLHRVALHVGRANWDLLRVETAQFATATEVLGDDTVWHELYALLEERFSSFPDECVERYYSFLGQLRDESEQFRYLWPIREHLPHKWMERYRELEDHQESGEHPDFRLFHETGFFEPKSILSAEDMADMKISDLVTTIQQTSPTDAFESPPSYGLARELERLVGLKTGEVTAHSMEFSNVGPEYIVAFLHGTLKAVKANCEEVQWQPLLNLCTWILEQPHEQGKPSAQEVGQHDEWIGARLDVSRLLKEGLRRENSFIPDTLLDSAWPTLLRLLGDSDPTAEDEHRRLEDEEPSTVAINTVRGTSLEALLFYAFRKRQALVDSPPFPQLGSFASEIVEQLDKHLQPSEEPSLALHSIYGKWFPQLYGLDKEWALANRNNIFPVEDPERLEAAWHAYMAFSRVYFDIYWALESVYSYAIRYVQKPRSALKTLTDPDERLGGHLVLLYRHEQLALDDDSIEQYFAVADDELRFSVMTHAVRGLEDIEESALPDACDSLKSLWNWRAGHLQNPAKQRELSAFCWWFIKDAFDDAWAVNCLGQALESGARLELEGLVLKKLHRLASHWTSEVLRCVEAIAMNERNRYWGVYQEELRGILGIGLSSSDASHREKAEELVHEIGSQGFFSLRDLIGR